MARRKGVGIPIYVETKKSISILSVLKAIILFLVVSACIAFFYPTFIKPQLNKLEAGLSDPVQKGLIKIVRDYIFGFFYYMWYKIFEAVGWIGPQGLIIIEKTLSIPVGPGNVTITKNCICYCS